MSIQSQSMSASTGSGRRSYRQRTSTGRQRPSTDSLLRYLDDSPHLTGERTALLAQRAIQPVYHPREGSQHNLLTNSTFIESEEIPTDDRDGSRIDMESDNSLILGDEYDNHVHVSRPRITCRHMLCSRRPKGRAVPLVLLLYFLETFAFFSTLNIVRQLAIFDGKRDSWANFMYVFLYASAGRVLYPIAGVIADAYLGRYRVIHIGLWLFWILFVILTLSLALDIKSPRLSIAVFVIVAVLFSAASGSVEANIIPFGADQLSQGASSTELSSYFYWHYFARNAGGLANFIVSLIAFHIGIGIDDLSAVTSTHVWVKLFLPLISILCVTIALILHYCFRHLYYHDTNRENPLKLVVNVVYFAATVKRQLPRFRRAFRFGEEKKPRIELAKVDYDGIFTSEQVEEVKTFCRIVLILYSLGGCFITYGATYAMFPYQMNALASNISLISHHGFLDANLFSLINFTSILIALPILNHVILVCLPNTNIRVRLGLGVFLICLSAGIAGFLQWSFSFHHTTNLDSLQQLLWLVLPSIVNSIGEMLVFVTALEFIYAQSPNNMKGMLSGLLYFALGIFGGGGSVFFYKYPITFNTIAWFHFIFVVVGSIGFVMYTIVACLYRNRERPTTDGSEGEAIRRIVAQRVFSS